MKINDLYKTKKRTLSFEIFPPKKDTELRNIDDTLTILSDLDPDFISVTFGTGEVSDPDRTISLAKKIKEEYKVEPVVHLTCLHYDKKEIDHLAGRLQDEGIENILALRGDRNAAIPDKNEFKYSTDLINYLKQKYEFCLLGACYPECHPESGSKVNDLLNLKAKVDAGASALLSQLFFDNKTFYDFHEKCRIADINVPVIPGIMPVINASQIKRMVSLCHASFPERFQKIIDRYEDKKAALFDAGLYYAISQIIDLIAAGSDGVHIYTMNRPSAARRICEGIRNII